MSQAKNTGQKFAALDLGSNSFRLLVSEFTGDDQQILANHLHTVRLAEGMGREAALQAPALQRALESLSRMAATLTLHGNPPVRICATAALRRATNPQALLSPAAHILPAPIEIISGKEEAYLCMIGVLSRLRQRINLPTIIADVGGGSTELIALQNLAALKDHNYLALSHPLGAVNLTETMSAVSPPATLSCDLERSTLEEITVPLQQLSAFLGQTRHQAVPPPQPPTYQIIGCGGTATALAALHLNLREYDGEKVNGQKVSSKTLDSISCHLLSLSSTERNNQPGLGQGRGDIIIAGLIIYQTIIKELGCPEIIISDGGLVEGIIQTLRDG